MYSIGVIFYYLIFGKYPFILNDLSELQNNFAGLDDRQFDSI